MAKIVYLSPYFWPETIGSAPYCLEVASALKSAGHDVRVYAFRPHYPSLDAFLEWSDGQRDEEILEGMLIRRVPASARGRGGFRERLQNDIQFLGHAVRTAAFAETAGTAVVVAYTPSVLSALGGAIIAGVRRARLIVVVHDIESGLARSLEIVKNKVFLALIRFFERIAINRADRIIVLTEGMARYLRMIGCRPPIQVLPIWSEVFLEVSPERDPSKIRIGYSGNFGKKQNLEQVIPLIQKLWERRPEIEVVLRGDGSEKARIRSQIDELHAENVRFENLVPREQFVEMLQGIDIHLVPQALNVANYALPSKIVSIMAAGRPFICIAERDSPLDLIARESGAGICIHPGEEEKLFSAVVELASDADRREEMAEAGRRYVGSSMNRETILESYVRIVCGEAGSSDDLDREGMFSIKRPRRFENTEGAVASAKMRAGGRRAHREIG